MLTPTKLAREANVNRGTVYAIEAGKWLPNLETVRKLSEALEVDPMEVDEFKAAIERSAQQGKGPARV